MSYMRQCSVSVHSRNPQEFILSLLIHTLSLFSYTLSLFSYTHSLFSCTHTPSSHLQLLLQRPRVVFEDVEQTRRHKNNGEDTERQDKDLPLHAKVGSGFQDSKSPKKAIHAQQTDESDECETPGVLCETAIRGKSAVKVCVCVCVCVWDRVRGHAPERGHHNDRCNGEHIPNALASTEPHTNTHTTLLGIQTQPRCRGKHTTACINPNLHTPQVGHLHRCEQELLYPVNSEERNHTDVEEENPIGGTDVVVCRSQ